MYYSMVFFTNVSRLLQERRLTKKWLAEHAGLSNSFITDITKCRNLSLKTMEAIAKALNVPLPALLTENDMDRRTQKELAQDSVLLPEGYEWVIAILPSYRAFMVHKWADETKKKSWTLGLRFKYQKITSFLSITYLILLTNTLSFFL